MITKEELKKYATIDYDTDDDTIEWLIKAADLYIKKACKFDYEDDETAKLAQALLITHWYDNRKLAEEGKVLSPISYALDALLIQIKYCKNKETSKNDKGAKTDNSIPKENRTTN